MYVCSRTAGVKVCVNCLPAVCLLVRMKRLLCGYVCAYLVGAGMLELTLNGTCQRKMPSFMLCYKVY